MVRGGQEDVSGNPTVRAGSKPSQNLPGVQQEVFIAHMPPWLSRALVGVAAFSQTSGTRLAVHSFKRTEAGIRRPIWLCSACHTAGQVIPGMSPWKNKWADGRRSCALFPRLFTFADIPEEVTGADSDSE